MLAVASLTIFTSVTCQNSYLIVKLEWIKRWGLLNHAITMNNKYKALHTKINKVIRQNLFSMQIGLKLKPYHTFWNTRWWQRKVSWRPAVSVWSLVKSPLSSFSICQCALKIIYLLHSITGFWIFKLIGMQWPKRYLHVIIASVSVMDYVGFANFCLPRRLECINKTCKTWTIKKFSTIYLATPQ